MTSKEDKTTFNSTQKESTAANSPYPSAEVLPLDATLDETEEVATTVKLDESQNQIETPNNKTEEEKVAPEVAPEPTVYFEDLALSDDVLDALWDMRFEKCTPVQAKCIPHILEGKRYDWHCANRNGQNCSFSLADAHASERTTSPC